MVLKEMGGKTMKAMLVFAFCIEYIKDRVLERLHQATDSLNDDDVRWVLTVPAIWSDQARQFMIEAAAKVTAIVQNYKFTYMNRSIFCQVQIMYQD